MFNSMFFIFISKSFINRRTSDFSNIYLFNDTFNTFLLTVVSALVIFLTLLTGLY